MMSTRSILSAVNAVNLVNTVNAVKYAPPSGGVAKDSHEIALALISNSDFGEITDNGADRRRAGQRSQRSLSRYTRSLDQVQRGTIVRADSSLSL
jgi:hypothetical protein